MRNTSNISGERQKTYLKHGYGFVKIEQVYADRMSGQ